MQATQTTWQPIQEPMSRNDFPDGYNFLTLLLGKNGPMIGQIHEESPDVFVIKVHTLAGLIPAKTLGCTEVTFIDCGPIAPLDPNIEKVTPLTADLMDDLEGWVEDEPGVWFLDNPDDPTDLSVMVRQRLRDQRQFDLVLFPREEGEQGTTIQLRSLEHLKAELEERGITFEVEEGGDDDE